MPYFLWSPLKGRMAHQKLIDQDSQCILVACWHRLTIPLFWGYISGSAMNVLVAASSCRSEFGDPKASHQQIGAAWILFPTADKEVGRMNILMDKLVLVRIL